MDKTVIGTFPSKTRGIVTVCYGYDSATIKTIHEHSSDPNIVHTLGTKDLERFNFLTFPKWILKGGGRHLYTAWCGEDLAGLFWIGGEPFPALMPNSSVQPAYTAAWRTGYVASDGGTYEGEGIGKRLALAGIADLTYRTKTRVSSSSVSSLPPLDASGVWIDTDVDNIRAQALYQHLGNTAQGQDPIGFEVVGEYETPDHKRRLGMVASPETIKKLVLISAELIHFETNY